MMTANLDIIYYTPVTEEGRPTQESPAKAVFNERLDAWVDVDTGVAIRFLGLVLGEDAVYSSTSKSEVESWIQKHH